MVFKSDGDQLKRGDNARRESRAMEGKGESKGGANTRKECITLVFSCSCECGESTE
jgi:hypothetical protein